MSRTQHHIQATQLPEIIADPQRGIISLVGDMGGLSQITGEVTASNLVMGALAIETEHGTVYLDPDSDILISEDHGPYRETADTEATVTCDTCSATSESGWGDAPTCLDCTPAEQICAACNRTTDGSCPVCSQEQSSANPELLYAINDTLAITMERHFDWRPDSQDDLSALDDATHQVAAVLTALHHRVTTDREKHTRVQAR